MDSRLTTSFRALQIALGLTATLAGLDKFFNILADWGHYVSPLVAQLLPFSVGTLMALVGVVEITVGVAILAAAPRLGAYVASAWLLLVAVNLAVAGYFDVAVRDVVMSIAAFTLARAIEVGARVPASSLATAGGAARTITALGLAALLGVAGSQAAEAAPMPMASPQQAAQTSPALLNDHISIAVDIVKFAKAGDKASQQQARSK